ncbi:protein B602L [Elysia marginata]|uniref:Protein B602L n=1 Tax=Elysia marginata TaxID=1093978 RepID=A0AAV4GRL3_9GAST|nr:protein B602L [Elysia marginata]
MSAPSGTEALSELSFEELLEDVINNPEKVFDKTITPEQVLALQKKMNPYAYVAGNTGSAEQKRSVAASYTNLRADYLQRFTMTSLVGFLFRMLEEWEVPVEVRRWKVGSGKKASPPPTPWTPNSMLMQANVFQELATSVASKADEATKAIEKAKAADEAFLAAAKTASSVELASQKSRVEALFKTADASLSKARGMQYMLMSELCKLGEESDSRIDAFARVVRQHPEMRETLDSHPRRRKAVAGGQAEMPASVAKKIISNFLCAWFEFNPDAHVRSAYDEFVVARDTAEDWVEGLGHVPADKADPARLPLSVVRASAPAFVSDEDREAFEALTVSREAYNASVYFLRNETAAKALLQALEKAERFRRYMFPIPKDSPARPAVDVIPPQDTFHRWRYYMEVNYEELRTATETLYHEKPDLDWALILYEYFEGSTSEVDSAFADFRDKHQDEVISDIKGIDFGGWTLLGDLKENRAKMSFYNKHTDVLKRIIDRHAEDKKLGQDLMRNRVRQLKAKNIREAGPDAPGLADYQTQNAVNGLGGIGAERVISREEMFRLERAQGNLRAAQELKVLDQCHKTIEELSETAKVRELLPEEDKRLKDAQKDLIFAQEMVEVPNDAIQVDVWTHDTASGAFAKTKFFTKAEAPKQRPPAAAGAAEEKEAAFSQIAEAATGGQTAGLALSVDAQTSSVANLAPFAQHELAREIAASKIAETLRHTPVGETDKGQ